MRSSRPREELTRREEASGGETSLRSSSSILFVALVVVCEAHTVIQIITKCILQYIFYLNLV